MKIPEIRIIFNHVAIMTPDGVSYEYFNKSMGEIKDHIMKQGYSEEEFDTKCKVGFFEDDEDYDND